MFRKENLIAFSALWLILSMTLAYGVAQFLYPDSTVGTGGFLGLSSTEKSVFNYQLFTWLFAGIFLLSPLIHAWKKLWVITGVEMGLMATIIGFSLWLGPVFAGLNYESGILGFNSQESLAYDEASLLLVITAIGGTYILIRSALSYRKKGLLKLREGWVRIALYFAGITASVFYIIGLHEAVFHSTQFMLFEEEMTLVDSVLAFFYANEYFLGVIIIVFTLLFPVIKFIYMYWGLLATPGKAAHRINKVLSILGKYSMLDVFVIALLLLNMKFESAVIDMELRSGMIFFSLSILINMGVTTFLIYKDVHKEEKRINLEASH